MTWTEPKTDHQRFFGALSGGDRRQLGAWDTRVDPEDNRVYLEVGQAQDVRDRTLVPGPLLARCPDARARIFSLPEVRAGPALVRARQADRRLRELSGAAHGLLRRRGGPCVQIDFTGMEVYAERE